jgi:polar amino acid transport system substrate-binding protein
MKRHYIWLSLLIVMSILLSACASTASGSHLEAIKNAGVMKVGTSADYPPFEYVDASGNKAGFDIELMEEIAKRMGVSLEWVDMPFDSLIAGVQEGKIDASISAFNYTEERDQVVDFTDPYYTGEDAFTVAEGFVGMIANPEDVAAYKVGVQTGTTQDEWLTDTLIGGGLMAEGNLYRYERADQVALDLKNGRVDVMMADYIPAKALAEQLGGLKIAYIGVVSSGPMNIVIPEGDTELAQEMNAIIKQLLDEGFVTNLGLKHFGQ